MHISCFSIVLILASLAMQLTSVKTLNETNFEDGKESLDLYMAITNMEFSLREEEPPTLTPKSTTIHIASRKKWENSNRVGLLKYTMRKSIWFNLMTFAKISQRAFGL